MSATRDCDLLVIGCGYLGERVAHRSQERGQTVSVLTRSAARADEFQGRGWNAVIGDVCVRESLESLPSARCVLWAVGFDRAATHSQEAVYVDGLANVCEILKGRCDTFVYISSSSVYGQSDGSWVDESSPTVPTQPGGQYCLRAERLVQEREPAARHRILRLSGIYGPNRLLSRVAALQAGETLSGSPAAWLNLIHVDDAAEAVDAVLASEGLSEFETFLVSDDRPLTRGDYYGRLAELVSAPVPRFDEDQTARRGSGGLNKRCSNRKLKSMTGWQPRYPSALEGLDALFA
ncbi:MAG: NAD-dependent epimerase/dehydratase family protein [Planctomycetaceae bacterium]|nr:NAD-dependent epimerase/dehydratase family protein [Planctomycetaceae bacterium]